MVKKSDKLKVETEEVFKLLPARVFLIQRRVMTDLYKAYGLTGYQIDMLLLVMEMGDYTVGNIVTGPMLRAKSSRRFQHVMRSIADKLVSEGFLEYLYKDGETRYGFRLGITNQAYSFALAWRDSINRHLESDGAELVLNARFSWEKAAKKKSLESGD